MEISFPSDGGSPRRPGRPRKYPEGAVTPRLYIPYSIWNQVVELTSHQRTSISELVTQALREYLEKHGGKSMECINPNQDPRIQAAQLQLQELISNSRYINHHRITIPIPSTLQSSDLESSRS